ncbi:magnesium chelatase subunit H [Lyngbya confervoides]|uniref:magnesium chelatase n=1 Tax=Lyngbya confervoides BDU141951 TaxID=1574623 RepID=A0ABD4T0R7_9CYAN|nr:magnesium chelatase subunit H [Lyngbya confervoides]MCM1982088.1 magnesium chelatase subunit H [Lyngbya confervoides BDU141951]
MVRIVLIIGFESFNLGLYGQALSLAKARCPDLDLHIFSDRDLQPQAAEIEALLEQADVFFASLIFDYDQVEWICARIQHIPIRLIFESALELMRWTQLGQFAIGHQPKGMPKPIKFILDKFGSGREEDKLAGYLSFLKVGPKLLKYIPVSKVQDLRNWLIIYGYWNAGGAENVAAMCWAIAQQYFNLAVGDLPAPVETPNLGLLHPDHEGYWESPRAYLHWYHQTSPQAQEWPRVGILLYRKHVITQQPYIPQLIRYFEQAQLLPVPIFINGVEGHAAVRDLMTSNYEQQQPQSNPTRIRSLSKEAIAVDAIVSTLGFPLVGGPAGSMEAGRQVAVAQQILWAKNLPYIVAAPLLIQDIHSWTRQGINGLQSVVLYALPELDGAIDTVPLGGLVGNDIYLIPERVQRLTGRLHQWIKLRHQPKSQRKIAILLYGFPPGYGATGTAALLNVPKSLIQLLRSLQAEGYKVGEIPEDGEALLEQVRQADNAYADHPGSARDFEQRQRAAKVQVHRLEKWLGYRLTHRIEQQWNTLTGTGIKTFGDEFYLGGVQLGNVWIGVQPPLGIAGDPMRLMFERDMTPHPQYAAFYQWLQRDFQADALIHFGMHGTVEWLPGSPLGNTGYSWPDVLLGNLPNLYIYAANNPSESILAKRRGYGVILSHNIPPYGRVDLYKELALLKDLIAEYREDPLVNEGLREVITKKILDAGLQTDCPFKEAQKLGIEFTLENARLFSPEVFGRYLIDLYDYLLGLENRLFSSGLHVLGEAPSPEALRSYLNAYFTAPKDLPEPILEAIAHGSTAEEALAAYRRHRHIQQPGRAHEVNPAWCDRSHEAVLLRDRLQQTPDEITNLIRGLNGEYIPPAPGGDLLRDGIGVLPTGRNIHALDPYRMPSAGAVERGRAIAQKLIAQHREEQGDYPETIAVMLWGLDAIKTRGESLGILLELVGAHPIQESTGRIVRYGLRPLSDLDHPRIDVLANLSGIFRDSFGNILELLDDLFLRAAEVAEPEDQNFIRKHALSLQAQGIDQPTARLFSNPAGDFGSLVNDRVTDANWECGEDLAQTWRDRNAFSYGRHDRGQTRPEVLQTLLNTTGQIIQQIDSVEYGLTDIQEYYANTGAMKKAMEQVQGKQVSAKFVESFSKNHTPLRLEKLLRIEYRSKLLNPKWATAMADQGSGGVYEISQRMTALIGWSGTADFRDSWVYDQAAETYALDSAMAERLRKANPEAFCNIVGRMLEAHGRGFWSPNEQTLTRLQQLYELADQELEKVGSK